MNNVMGVGVGLGGGGMENVETKIGGLKGWEKVMYACILKSNTVFGAKEQFLNIKSNLPSFNIHTRYICISVINLSNYCQNRIHLTHVEEFI